MGLLDCLYSVGIGSDYDGVETVPEGLEDVSKYPELVSPPCSLQPKALDLAENPLSHAIVWPNSSPNSSVEVDGPKRILPD
jgi:hypothetical protein